jgi:hypothetical protein
MRSGPYQRTQGPPRGNRPPQPSQGSNQRAQTFTSVGPGERIRGNAYQICERYVALAQETARSGDNRVDAENYYQHAEHYFRVNKAARDGNSPEPSAPMDRTAVEPDPAPADRGEMETGGAPQTAMPL